MLLNLVETHCVQKETVEFNDYIVYSHNRLLNVNSKKGSGGIAIAFHKSVIECHTILSVYYGVDGQLAVKLRCNKTNIKLGVLGLYLSPDTYKYGQDAESFFNQASVIWQDLGDCDLILGGGDVNARTKDLIDFVPEVDGHIIPARKNLDNKKNAHADSFITFLKDNRSVILNGRITPEYDNYTFVSPRGSSVPDYLFCPVDNLLNCVEMKVHLITDIIDRFGLLPPNSLPDHSLLSAKFVTSYFDMKNYVHPAKVVQNAPSIKVKKAKKNLSKINDNFMMSHTTFHAVNGTITKLELYIQTLKHKDNFSKSKILTKIFFC